MVVAYLICRQRSMRTDKGCDLCVYSVFQSAAMIIGRRKESHQSNCVRVLDEDS
jgi:hypothetical protein